MEKDTKQHSISYNKGITNQPSYILTDDGELSSCVGITFENGELKPIQHPKRLINNTDVPDAQILAVHDGRYIYESYDSVAGKKVLLYTYNSGANANRVMYFSGNLVDVEIVGNTVIASTTEETHYALWRGETNYKDLENKIPEPEVELRLQEEPSFSGTIRFQDLVVEEGVLKEHQEEFNDEVWGNLRKMIRLQHEEGKFVFPFVARIAVELYDGSYILHSTPHIMLPWYGIDSPTKKGDFYMFKDDWMGGWGRIYIPTSSLEYKICPTTDYSDWSDIVRNVSLFVSREHTLFKEDTAFARRQWDTTECGYRLNRAGSVTTVKDIGNGYPYFHNNSTHFDEYRLILNKKNDSEIINGLKEESVFFKLCDLGIHGMSDFRTTKGMFSSTTIENIETNQQFPNDDFHSHDSILNGKLYAYNGRLHVFGASRKLFGGFTTFFEWKTSSQEYYTIVVTIKTDSGNKKVKTDPVRVSEAIGAFYFFYPDSRAITADIYIGNIWWKQIALTEHPGLNGAYWISGTFPTTAYAPQPSASGSSVPSVDSIEFLPNILMVSEANNPIVFLSKGYVKVSNANIIGMAAVTMALSEYQHGNHPLAVFAEDGIWSLSLNAEGYYVVGQNVSREVCNNASSITQVDNGIFFVSAKGLMYLDTAGVKCVSAQMKGTTFDDFIDTCFMAYDYRDSLLKIFKPGASYHYVYNMKTGTFSTDTGAATNTVNNYPDTLIQYHGSSWETYSLLDKPDEQHDGDYDYEGYIETRPMKFGNILTLKSIRHIRHLYVMNNADVSLTVTASNDGVNWTSPALTSLRGKPWKLFKFRIDFDRMHATDRYAGTVVWTQERRTEKPR